jgi:hypothetical protein
VVTGYHEDGDKLSGSKKKAGNFVTCMVTSIFCIRTLICRVTIVNRRMKKSSIVQGGSNMTGTNCDLFTHNQSWSYLNHLVFHSISSSPNMVMNH